MKKSFGQIYCFFLLGQDKVLIGPPDNIYHGPILSPIASEFMTDLNKGSFSTEEALDLMNNYVSGSQDMTSSIKKLAGVLNKVHTRDQTQQKEQTIGNNLAPQKVNGMMMREIGGQQNSLNLPLTNQGPINQPSLNGLATFKPNRGQPFGDSVTAAPSGGEIAALLAFGPNKQFGGNEMSERWRENDGEESTQRSYAENHFDHDENYAQNNYNEQHQQLNLINANQGNNEASAARVNSLQREKPPPVHLFQGAEPGLMTPFPNSNNNNNNNNNNYMFNGGERHGGQMTDQLNGIEGPMNVGLRENEFVPFMDNMQRERPDYPAVPNNVDTFLNRIDPHELSQNPSVAMPENGLARHTLSRRPAEPNEPRFESDQFHGLAGPVKLHKQPNEEYTKVASIEHFHSNRGNAISDLYSDSLFPEDIADIESLRGSLQGKTLSAFDKQEESQANAQGRSETHPNKAVKVSYPLRAVTKTSKFRGRYNLIKKTSYIYRNGQTSVGKIHNNYISH